MTKSLTERVELATQQVESAGEVYSEVKCADSNTMVDTTCGMVPSLRKVLKDLGGYQYKGEWLANTAYEAKDQVKIEDGTIWLCLENHTSGSDFQVDASAGKWLAWQVINDTPVFNRRVIDFGVGVAFGPYAEDGRTLIPRLRIGGVEYVAVSDITENLTFASADIDDRFDGTVLIHTSDGEKVFSKVLAEAITEPYVDGAINKFNTGEPVVYLEGIVIDKMTYKVTKDGNVYVPKTVPFTTAGWDNNQWNILDASKKAVLSTDSTTPRTLGDRFSDIVNPKDFGAKSDGITNDTFAIQLAVDYAITNKKILHINGNFLSDTIVISGNLTLETNCQITSINDVVILEIKNSKVNHTGYLELKGVNREGRSRGITFESSRFSTFDTVYITNVALGIEYLAKGNNNGIKWNSVRIELVSAWYDTTFTKGEIISASNIYNIGEFTTDTPINTDMGSVVIDGKSYPVCPKEGESNTYYIGCFSELPDTSNVRHYTGGGILANRHGDNGNHTYGSIYCLSCRGISLTFQSNYGSTVNGGGIEGCQTNIIIGGIYVDDKGPRNMFSVRNMFSGIHTEGNTANQPLVSSVPVSGTVFDGCLIRNGIRCHSYNTSVKFFDIDGSDCKSSEFGIIESKTSGSHITPSDPSSIFYRDVTISKITNINLSNLSVAINYCGQPDYVPISKMVINLLNIPVGTTHSIILKPSGINTVCGKADEVTVEIQSIPGRTFISLILLLNGTDFTFYTT